MTLRTIHLLFILLAMAAADMFGIWAISDYADPAGGGTSKLLLGIFSFVLGLLLIVYALWFVRKSDRSHVE